MKNKAIVWTRSIRLTAPLREVVKGGIDLGVGHCFLKIRATKKSALGISM